MMIRSQPSLSVSVPLGPPSHLVRHISREQAWITILLIHVHGTVHVVAVAHMSTTVAGAAQMSGQRLRQLLLEDEEEDCSVGLKMLKKPPCHCCCCPRLDPFAAARAEALRLQIHGDVVHILLIQGREDLLYPWQYS